jgi:endonuclease/exonuclease/phosphatase family metal-dependent hydrolase
MKIVTLNLRHNADRWEERFPLVVDCLHQEQADVIALQEVYLPIQQAHLIADALNSRTPHLPYAVYVEPKWGDDPWEGVGLLTRLPVLEHARLELPEGQRVAQRLLVVENDTRFHIANTHLHHRPIEDESIRLPQMQALITWMQSQSAAGWLLTGDMNAEPDSTTIHTAQEYLQSTYTTVHGTQPITFPTPLVAANFPDLAITIDYIFYDPRVFTVENAWVTANQPHPADPTLYPSDHFGLGAVLHQRPG